MKIDWQAAPAAPGMRRGAQRRVVSTAHTTMVNVDTAPDASFDRVAHRHEHEQWVIVLAGTLRMRCAETVTEMHGGDVLHVPPWAWHAAVGVGPEGARYLEISTPPRLDLHPGLLMPSPLEFQASDLATSNSLEDSHAR